MLTRTFFPYMLHNRLRLYIFRWITILEYQDHDSFQAELSIEFNRSNVMYLCITTNEPIVTSGISIPDIVPNYLKAPDPHRISINILQINGIYKTRIPILIPNRA